MKHSIPKLALGLALAAGLTASFISHSLSTARAAPPHTVRTQPRTPGQLWVSAYYAVWTQQAGVLTPSAIDYSAFSHLIHFAVVPGADGTVDPVKGGVTPAESAAVVGAAHKAGRKVLLSVGGWNTSPQFRTAYGDPCRAAFVQSLVSVAQTRGYDGLDIDMEPLLPTDTSGYEAFIHQLKAAMTAANPKLLLTAATAAQPELFARLSPDFDQINLMTYDLAGPWQGFKTWHNSALYGDGSVDMNPGQPYPSGSEMVERFVKAGVPARKLGLGTAFYGSVWTGADTPGQPIAGVTMQSGVAYGTLMDTYDKPERRRWDSAAAASYLSVDAPQKQFIPYDDERVCAEKVAYAKAHGLGGVMLWDLGSGYRASQPPGRREPLLLAVKRAWQSAK